MTKEFSNEVVVDSTYPGMHVKELMPSLNKEDNWERMLPEQEDGERPTSCPTPCPSVPLHNDEGIRLEGNPEMSGWTQGETCHEPRMDDGGLATTDLGVVDDNDIHQSVRSEDGSDHGQDETLLQRAGRS